MSKLIEHAEREMRLAGLYDKDADYDGMIPEAVMALVKAHSKQGHSGMSHEITMDIFNKVINFKPLTALTTDDSEWNDRSEYNNGTLLYQNKRNSSVFAKDFKDKDTWYSVSEPHSGCSGCKK